MSIDSLSVRKQLGKAEELPLQPAGTVCGFGPTLVVAPHPDDETLGCGGAIRLLQQYQVPVRVLVISDGTLSHPNSKRYPAPALKALRESETRQALGILGLEPGLATFLGYKDRSVPTPGQSGFEQALKDCQDYLARYRPATIMVPWRRDPHPDHRATWRLIRAAANRLNLPARLLEYPVWTWELAEQADMPRPGEVKAWRLDISESLESKLLAIRAYRSQTTDLIDDDPEAFRLTPEILAHFERTWELYMEE